MTTSEVIPNRDYLDAFQKAILDLDQSMAKVRNGEGDNWTVQEACEVYSILSNFKSQIAVLINDHENHLIDLMTSADTEAVVLESGQAVTKEYSKSRKGWKHKDLADVVASRIENLAYDIDTGERRLTPKDMIIKLLDYVQPSYWRVVSLSEIGVNADDYCESGEAEAKIRIGKVK